MALQWKEQHLHHINNLYAGSKTNCNIYGTTPSKNLKTICRWRLLHSATYALGKLFPSTILIETLSLLWRKKVMENLAFLDTLLKRNNGKISVLLYWTPTHTDQYRHYNSHHQMSCKESVVSSLFNWAYCIITSKDDLTQESARTKQALKENGYQKALLIKSLRESLTITPCVYHNNKRKPQISKRKIRMSINLLYVEGTTEKLRRILRSHKIRSTFYAESTLRKLFCKWKDRLDTEKKKNVIYVQESPGMKPDEHLVNRLFLWK